MKYMLFGLFLAFFAISNVVNGFPAYDDDGDDEVEIVPLGGYSGPYGAGSKKARDEYDHFDGVVDTGFHPVYIPRPQPYLPWNWDFSGFFERVDDIFRNMRDQVATRWSGEEDDFGKGNTTSKVEIVDGHKFTINTTSYVKDNGYGKSVINVRTIDVEPIKNDTTDGKTAKDDDKVKVETKIDSGEKPSKEESSVETIAKEEADNEIIGDIDEPQQNVEIFIDEHLPQNFLHSSRLNLNYPENDVDQYQYKQRPATWESMESGEIDNEIETDLLFDDENPKPINLANDIAINDILAAKGAPTHPDAEVFSVEEVPIEPMAASSGSSISYHLPKFQMARFEKIKK